MSREPTLSLYVLDLAEHGWVALYSIADGVRGHVAFHTLGAKPVGKIVVLIAGAVAPAFHAREAASAIDVVDVVRSQVGLRLAIKARGLAEDAPLEELVGAVRITNVKPASPGIVLEIPATDVEGRQTTTLAPSAVEWPPRS